ncbi:Uncharacterized protein TCM_042347 [Theobroma cacao]|uniref:Uncharacterized protein n=1 Tax=Theobroma cacao TaxID=3641 RepID=A0A061FJK8_THECC|nr:Uncharacterized protein TCM_042347 [Theobroma cacao]
MLLRDRSPNRTTGYRIVVSVISVQCSQWLLLLTRATEVCGICHVSVLGRDRWILVKIARTPRHLQGLVIACSSAANLGNMLLIILPAICEETNSPFGDSSTCAAYGEAYASLSLAILSKTFDP